MAQNNLGLMYDQGRGVEKDTVQAIFWLSKAAEQGVAHAQYNLASRYYLGAGVEKDEALGAFWYRQAKEQADPEFERALLLQHLRHKGLS